MDKRIAALTMARNDDFFLSRWVRYYGAQLGEENLFVVLHGLDQTMPAGLVCPAVNVSNVPHETMPRVKGDKHRIDVLNAIADRLLVSEGYDLVLGTDCDEFIIADPALNISLSDYLSLHPIPIGLSPLGIDLGQRMPQEATLRPELSILAQRRYGIFSPRYTKASIRAIPTPWGSGFHRLRRHNFTIAKGLYLIHTGNCDMERLKARMCDKSRIAAGWSKHIERRAKVILATTHRTAVPVDDVADKVRRSFQRSRFPWALNKPAHYGKAIVTELPERFGRIVI